MDAQTTLLAPWLAAVPGSAFDFLYTVKGPDFIPIFVGWFVLVFGAVLVLRVTGSDSAFVTFGGIVVFESLGWRVFWWGVPMACIAGVSWGS